MPDFPQTLVVSIEDSGKRLDQFLVSQLAGSSRARLQQLISEEKVLVNHSAAKPSLRLREGDCITVLGEPVIPPLRAIAEDIPLDVVYEDDDLAIINKPAGMMVHAGAGATESERNRGTLVNALLHRFRNLSKTGGDLRPGIVHRLDKETSGLIVVAKNDLAHRKLAEQFSKHEVKKTYIALVHGWVEKNRGTINSSISRDQVRRIRMTTRGFGGRDALSHYTVQRRIDSEFGKFTLLEVRIDTGRTHQIRVHLSSIRHPIVGDTLYGAPAAVRSLTSGKLSLPRNFLHAASLKVHQPSTGEELAFARGLPADLEAFLQALDKKK